MISKDVVNCMKYKHFMVSAPPPILEEDLDILG